VTTELRRWCEARRREGSARFNAETSAALGRTLHLVRDHLAMDVAWLSHAVDRASTVQLVDGDPEPFSLWPTSPAMATFSDRIFDGSLPPVSGELHRLDPALADGLGAGSYAAVTVLGSGPTPYGLLACLSREPTDSLRPRDADVMRLFAEMQTEEIAAYERRHSVTEAFRERAEEMLDRGGVEMALQPIVDLRTGQPVASEALARFPAGPYTTEDWFTEARRAGAGQELELDAISAALRLIPAMPAPQRLSVNGSPDLITSDALLDRLADQPLDRLIIEVTEHNLAESVDALMDRVHLLQQRGAWVAIDDAGTGYSSLHQIIQLGPDIIKLDRALVSDVDTDPRKRALASAFVTFTSQAGTGLVAEGVETAAELRTLEQLGVPFAQGYYLARPKLTRPRPEPPVQSGQAAPSRS
jgi:EAL domain-containing protein (putative c-di-GMP-specific phosphodiesterase class I)